MNSLAQDSMCWTKRGRRSRTTPAMPPFPDSSLLPLVRFSPLCELLLFAPQPPSCPDITAATRMRRTRSRQWSHAFWGQDAHHGWRILNNKFCILYHPNWIFYWGIHIVFWLREARFETCVMSSWASLENGYHQVVLTWQLELMKRGLSFQNHDLSVDLRAQLTMVSETSTVGIYREAHNGFRRAMHSGSLKKSCQS